MKQINPANSQNTCQLNCTYSICKCLASAFDFKLLRLLNMLQIYNKAFYFFEDRLALACTNLFTYNLCISQYFIQALAKMFTSLMERYYVQILLDTESRFLCHPHRRDRLFCFNFSLKPLLTVCYYHVTYAYQSDFTVYSCPKFKELFARNRRDI